MLKVINELSLRPPQRAREARAVASGSRRPAFARLATSTNVTAFSLHPSRLKKHLSLPAVDAVKTRLDRTHRPGS